MRITDIQNKDRTLNSVRETNQITYREKPILISDDFSIQTLKDTQTLKVKVWEKTYHLHGLHKQAGVSILISNQVVIKPNLEGIKKDISYYLRKSYIMKT